MLDYWNRLDPYMRDLIEAGGIFAAFALVALGTYLVWMRFIARFVRHSQTPYDDVLSSPLRGLAVWSLILAGLYYALRSLDAARDSAVLRSILDKGFAIVWVILAIAASLRIFGQIIQLRIRQSASEGLDAETRLHFVRKLVTAVLWIFGGLYILRAAGVDTSPLLAGGAVGGLILGLALQDTLSNIFAGFFLNIDRPIKIGNLVKLETGEEGFVEDIGWRYTKLRLWSNVQLVVPNSKLSQSILTNYNFPVENTSVYTYCGVAYDTDLEEVERVALEVAAELISEDEGADKTWDPVLRYQEFGDSSVNFVVVMRCAEPTAQFRIKSEYIKRLHRRFGETGIEIPFPMRTVVLKGGSGPVEAGARENGEQNP